MALGTALVTGASAGIGEVFARRLAQRNFDLVLVARRRERLEAIATALADSYGIRCDVEPADLSMADAPQQIADRLAAREIRVDFLVNNAGIGLPGAFAELPYDRVANVLRLNIDSLTRLAHLFLPAMVRHRRGWIVNVASTGGFQPVPYFAVYAATKAYVLHFSEALAEEVRPHGVVVSCLCPGPTTTEFNAVAGIDGDVGRFAYLTPEAVVDAALAGLDRGEAVVVPGVLNQLGASSVRMAPRAVVRKVAGLIFGRVAGR